jgi:hypothetical protein
MDANIRHGRGPKLERCAEQEMTGINNADADSEYLVCDIEYTFLLPDSDRVMGRIDLVAARRPDPRDQGAPCRLVFVELKYGTGAIDGDKAGLRAHMHDLRVLMEDGHLERRAAEMVNVVQQKRELGLVPATVSGFDLEKPVEYVVAVAAHKKESQKLMDALLGRVDQEGNREALMMPPPGVDVRIALFDAGEPLVLHHAAMCPLGDVELPEWRTRICSRDPLRPRPWSRDGLAN